jgi:hypothetical protein
MYKALSRTRPSQQKGAKTGCRIYVHSADKRMFTFIH